ncbi:unnamed protein product [Thelazia callipaeda]|uniref:WGS project CCBQ000000000 data, contig 00015 n=1 Tax=Thelazia callipaeda TaxID=103827 RepID=A0A0N5D2X5_THECL|nr:unnamed protein product [Thelazia callipaeda]
MGMELLRMQNVRWVRRLQLGIVTLTISSVPTLYFLSNGPYLKEYFEKRYGLSSVLPSHLQDIVNSEYENFLMSDDRIRKKKKVTFYLLTSEKYLDSVTHGALNSPWGARVALPFYTQFQTFDEAYNYCKEKLEPMLFMNGKACVVWESDIGRQIIETFVLSKNALKFMVQRDLRAHEPVKRSALFAFYWCCYTSIAFMLAHIMVNYYLRRNLLWFCGLSTVLNAPAWWGSMQNARLDWHTTDQSADADAARMSVDYGTGGKEFYQKLLKRNRLLRELIPDGIKKVSTVGDPVDANTSYWYRYMALMDLDAENKLLDGISSTGDS